MKPQQPVIYIVDDDQAIRDSLRFLIRSAGYQATTFHTADAFLQGYTNNEFGCLLLDVRMPGMSGLDLLRELKQRNSALPVIIMTGHGDIPMAVEAMRIGAADFLEKPYNDDRLLSIIQDNLERQTQILDQEQAQREASTLLTQLTPREREVMDLLVQGKLNKVVAAELDISPRTVEVHRAHIMDKLNAKSLADLVRLSLL